MNAILKFGGTSICQQGLNQMMSRINFYKNNVVIVCSAKSNVTNLLFNVRNDLSNIDRVIQIYDEFIKEINICRNDYMLELEKYKNKKLNEQDYIDIVAYGELISNKIVFDYLKNFYSKIGFLDSREYILATKTINNKYKYNVINKFGTSFDIIVFTGFICSNRNGHTVLMSRGGSDLTGSLLADFFKTKIYEIWSDVDGIYQIDPNIINNNLIVERLSYNTAQKISILGAKVIHQECIEPLIEKGIELHIKNTFSENSKNTIISNIKDGGENLFFLLEDKKNVLINIEKNDDDILTNILNKYNIEIKLALTLPFSKSIIIDQNFMLFEKLIDELSEKFLIQVKYDITIMSLFNNVKSYRAFLDLDINYENIVFNDNCLNIIISSELTEKLTCNIFEMLFKNQELVFC